MFLKNSFYKIIYINKNLKYFNADELFPCTKGSTLHWELIPLLGELIFMNIKILNYILKINPLKLKEILVKNKYLLYIFSFIFVHFD